MSIPIVQLGRTGLKVSRLCLGTMNFGPMTPENESHQILDRALDLGINFVDTADVYGWKKGEGWTEQIVGNWLAQGGRRRESMVLATKVYGEMGEGPNDRGLSAYHIRRACEDSLRRLKTDHIDLYQMHHIDRATPIDETWQAMEQLVREGKILYVGSSNFPAWMIAKMQMMVQSRHQFGLASEQCIYSLADRTVELEVLPACEHFGIGVLAWSPIAGGMLAGILGKQATGRRAHEWARTKLARHEDAVRAYEGFCSEIGRQPADIALLWSLRSSVVTSAIVGPRTIEQLEQSVQALNQPLTDDTLKRLDEVWPGPGGAAPEAYSW